MDFVKRLAATGEQLLEQADASAAAQVKDIRQGGHVVRAAADRLEKTHLNTDDPVQLRAELASAGEVLRHAQELAAEREQKLTGQLQKERAHHASEVDTLVGRIRALELHEKNLYAAQEQIKTLKEQLDRAAPQTLDVMELEMARKEAEDARAALNASARESSARCSELERANLELSKELRRLMTVHQTSATPSEPSPTMIELARKDYEERLITSNERRIAAESALTRETERCTSLEMELNRAVALAHELRASAAVERARKDDEIQAYKRENETLRAQMEALKHTTEANGQNVLEQRLEALSSHLEMKQRTIDALRSEKTALEVRLAAASTNTSVVMTPQVTIAKPSLAMERGADANRRRISRLPVFANRPELANAMDALDGFALAVGVLLRAKPYVRLGAIVYVVLTHLFLLHCMLSSRWLGGGGGSSLRGGNSS